MIIMLAHMFASFYDLLKRSEDYQDPILKEKQERQRRVELQEEAESELRQKVALFSGYNNFVVEKLYEFCEKVTALESNVSEGSQKLVPTSGDLDSLAKSVDSLKRQVDYSAVIGGNEPPRADALMERRIEELRKKTVETLQKASSLRSDVDYMRREFTPINDKWNAVVDQLTKVEV